MVYLLIILVGFVLGIFFGAFGMTDQSDSPIGELIVESSDPDGPYIFLEVENYDDLLAIEDRGTVLLKVRKSRK